MHPHECQGPCQFGTIEKASRRLGHRIVGIAHCTIQPGHMRDFQCKLCPDRAFGRVEMCNFPAARGNRLGNSRCREACSSNSLHRPGHPEAWPARGLAPRRSGPQQAWPPGGLAPSRPGPREVWPPGGLAPRGGQTSAKRCRNACDHAEGPRGQPLDILRKTEES